MFITRSRFVVSVCLLALVLSGCACAQVSDADRKLVTEIAGKIFPLVTQPPKGYAWPPKLDVDDSDEVNAYATLGPHRVTDTSFQPQVVILNGLLTGVTKGNPDYLAFIIAHETAHLALGHCKYDPAMNDTAFRRVTFTREQEIEADMLGMEYALKAGYSFRRALDGIRKMAAADLPYSSFEGLGVDHPSWNDRLSFIDKEQSKLWRAMSAFDNGNVFLMVEQYVPAERCFLNVTKEFPKCHEAWANLGYAQLMRYCDALETSDLKKFAIGQLVTGGFYRRPSSLEAQVRGIDEELWWKAVGSLRQSLQVKADQPMVKANLGIAYLVRPAGSDVGTASRFFQEAVDEIAKDKTIGPMERAAVLLNSGVAGMAGGNLQLCLDRLEEAAKAGGQEIDIRGELIMIAGEDQFLDPTAPINCALLYNAAHVLSKAGSAEGKKLAIDYLVEYLEGMSPASAWWPIAYEQYQSLCREQKITPKTAQQLRSRDRVYRPLSSVTVGGKVIVVSSSLRDVRTELGAGEETTIVPNTTLKRVRYAAHGVDVLATNEVLAIVLHGPNAPALELRESGLGAKSTWLRIGMTVEALEALFPEFSYDLRPMVDPDVDYRFYFGLGLAVKITQGKVEELLIVQIPEL